MQQEPESFDVDTSPDVLRLAEEVQMSGRPRALRRDGKIVALVVPVAAPKPRRLRKRTLSPEDIAAFHAAAGTWKNIDVERFLADVYAARDVPDDRPAVKI